MIPVMLFGVLFAKKHYTIQEYLCVAVITLGIVMFNLSGEHKQVPLTPYKLVPHIWEHTTWDSCEMLCFSSEWVINSTQAL